VVGFGSARTIWTSATRRFRRTFAALADTVTTAVERGVTGTEEPSPD
jgi:hypothetical protein